MPATTSPYKAAQMGPGPPNSAKATHGEDAQQGCSPEPRGWQSLFGVSPVSRHAVGFLQLL